MAVIDISRETATSLGVEIHLGCGGDTDKSRLITAANKGEAEIESCRYWRLDLKGVSDAVTSRERIRCLTIGCHPERRGICSGELP